MKAVQQRLPLTPDSQVSFLCHRYPIAVSSLSPTCRAIFTKTAVQSVPGCQVLFSRLSYLRGRHAIFTVPAGSPSRGGDVAVYVSDIN